MILFLILVIAAASIGGFLFFRMRSILTVQRINSVDLEERLLPNIASKVKNDEMMAGYTNIALFGVDSRSGDLLEGVNSFPSTAIRCSMLAAMSIPRRMRLTRGAVRKQPSICSTGIWI